MNKNLSRLFKIVSKKNRLIIGLMSGTSLDGLDVALCKLSGHGRKTNIELLKFETIAYSRDVKARIIEVFARPQVEFKKLCILNPWIGNLHGEMVLECLTKWKCKATSIDLIASHGQTVFHAPAFLNPRQNLNATLQVGDGDHVAVTTGIITVSDFRQKHTAKGGEGAPLAVYGDFLLMAHRAENRILLNIGGIANFTYLPAGHNPKKVFVSDTGPGNTLLDQTVRDHDPKKYFDRDAVLATRGQVNSKLLAELRSDPFFKMPFPKTTGPELFNLDFVRHAKERSGSGDCSLVDTLATLTRFSAETIAEAIQTAVGKKRFEIYFSGGGAHNPLMVKWIREVINIRDFRTSDELGIPGDAKEAMLFAVLANETIVGGMVNFGSRTKIPSVSMGKISFPD